ncbi:MAG: hydroxyacid dehydrogenase [Oscillospiraceae bacterium]
MKGCFVCKEGSDRLDYVFASGRKEQFSPLLELCPETIHYGNLEKYRSFLRETEVILATWDMIPFTEEELAEHFPSLRLVLYAAGSVQAFARPFLKRGIHIASAWGAMSIPVAQFTVASIVFLNKGAFLSAEAYRNNGFGAGKQIATVDFPGSYSTKVGILGAGMIGSLVISMLRDYNLELMVYDPFLSPNRQKELGLERLYSLEEIFAECQTISNHIANNERTVGMLNYSLFSRMKHNAAFLNTGRGAQVVEADLVRALREEPRRFALLDVTWPEPVAPEHPFLTLPNVLVFPHIAGYAAAEMLAMPDCMLEELARWQKGEPLRYEVTTPMLETMA